MSFLLDTCFISELMKPNPNPGVIQWANSSDESRIFLSVLTLGEIQKGITKLPLQSKKKEKLQLWLTNDLRQRFSNRLLLISEKESLKWGEIQGLLELKGRPMSTLDGLIAATALVRNYSVVTRNVADFEGSGVKIVNPWIE